MFWCCTSWGENCLNNFKRKVIKDQQESHVLWVLLHLICLAVVVLAPRFHLNFPRHHIQNPWQLVWDNPQLAARHWYDACREQLLEPGHAQTQTQKRTCVHAHTCPNMYTHAFFWFQIRLTMFFLEELKANSAGCHQLALRLCLALSFAWLAGVFYCFEFEIECPQILTWCISNLCCQRNHFFVDIIAISSTVYLCMCPRNMHLIRDIL